MCVENKPKITLVIPNYNLEKYLERTIESVVRQDYGAREIILVDGNSTDGSHAIIDKYRDRLDQIVIEPDEGHADALNKGFSRSSGEIMGWINSDDILLPGCLRTVSEIFTRFPEIEWITGNSSHISDQDHILSSYPPRPHSRIRFLMGDVRWVQQESTFWRRSLWDKVGRQLNSDLRLAVDFELWMRFFRHANLYGVSVALGAFRMRVGQRSKSFMSEYLEEVKAMLWQERRQLSQSFYERHADLLQLPFMMRNRHQADSFGDDITRHDVAPISIDLESGTWVNPNRPTNQPVTTDPSADAIDQTVNRVA